MTARFDPELPPEFAACLPTVDDFLKGLPEEFKKTLSGPQHAVLDENGDPQPATLLEWAAWMEHSWEQRILAREEIMRTGHELVPELYVVSTVFLGLNHQYFSGPPLWFETMVFGPPQLYRYKVLRDKWHPRSEDLWMQRYSTRAEALAGHAEGLAWLRDYIAKLGDQPYPLKDE